MDSFTRPEAAEISGLPYQTVSSFIHRQLIDEPFGWPHLVALTIANRMREQGVPIPAVRQAIQLIVSKGETALRRSIDAGNHVVVVSGGVVAIGGAKADALLRHEAATLVDLLSAVNHVDSAVSSIERETVVA